MCNLHLQKKISSNESQSFSFVNFDTKLLKQIICHMKIKILIIELTVDYGKRSWNVFGGNRDWDDDWGLIHRCW